MSLRIVVAGRVPNHGTMFCLKYIHDELYYFVLLSLRLPEERISRRPSLPSYSPLLLPSFPSCFLSLFLSLFLLPSLHQLPLFSSTPTISHPLPSDSTFSFKSARARSDHRDDAPVHPYQSSVAGAPRPGRECTTEWFFRTLQSEWSRDGT